MASAEEIRAGQRAVWAGLSAPWEKWDAIISDQLRPVGAAMIQQLGVADGHRHLDIASGTGEPGLSIAAQVPGAQVVLTDIAPEMLLVARRRAAPGLANFDTAVCSADALPFTDGGFDRVSVRFGYMFFPDLGRATAELVRVLAPGGRLCASVWVRPEENPWTTIAMRAIATEVELPAPDPDGPHMYRCAGVGMMRALFADAGLHDVAETDVGVDLVTRSPEEYWQMISEHVSIVAAALRQVDPPTRERIRAAALAEVRAYGGDGGVRVPGLARVVVGTKR